MSPALYCLSVIGIWATDFLTFFLVLIFLLGVGSGFFRVVRARLPSVGCDVAIPRPDVRRIVAGGDSYVLLCSPRDLL